MQSCLLSSEPQTLINNLGIKIFNCHQITQRGSIGNQMKRSLVSHVVNTRIHSPLQMMAGILRVKQEPI